MKEESIKRLYQYVIHSSGARMPDVQLRRPSAILFGEEAFSRLFECWLRHFYVNVTCISCVLVFEVVVCTII